MALVTHCPRCGTTISYDAEDAGRERLCRACGASVMLPDEVSPQQAAPPPLPPPAADENPYAVTAIAGSAYGYRPPVDPALQDGPEWERYGYSLRNYFATAKSLLLSPDQCFATMRRTGNKIAPVLYLIVGNFIGSLATALIIFLMFAFVLVVTFINPGDMPNAGPSPVGVLFIVALIYPVMLIVMQTLGLAIFVLLGALVLHLILLMLGGLRYPLETTVRATCYAMGSASVAGLIPFCGNQVISILGVIFTIWALIRLHELPWWKPVVAVISPVLFLCGGYFVFIFLVILLDTTN